MIVVGGESLVDLVPTQSTVDGVLAALSPRLGGGPFNTAVGTGRLGAQVGFLSRVSTDTFGEAVIDRLKSSNVDTSLLQRGAEPSTLAVVALGRDGGGKYTFYIENTADRLFADPGPLPERTSVLALGTLGMVLEPGASAYEAVLRREARRGVITVLDPNIRADLIADPDAYRARFASWLPDVRVLKVSEEDAAWLVNGPSASADPVAAAAAWLDQGPEAVVLTRGGDGLLAITRSSESSEIIEVPAAQVTVTDTIGAGDTVHAALLARLANDGVRGADGLRGLTPEWWRDTLRYAGAAAAVTVSRIGAEPPWSAELPAL